MNAKELSHWSLSKYLCVCPPPTPNPTLIFVPSVLSDQRKLQNPLAILVMFQLFNTPCLTHNVPGCQTEEAIIKAVRPWFSFESVLGRNSSVEPVTLAGAACC